MSKITVIDYGVGNLFSIARAIEQCGGEAVFSDDPRVLEAAERAVLPGVGAFGDGMRTLIETGLADAVRRFADTGRPLLAICLGMQMLMEESAEFGVHRGLGILPGKVRAIPGTSADGSPHKVPHIAWAALQEPEANRWHQTPLEGTAPGTPVYFVHSFAAQPKNNDDLIASYDYDGHSIAAAVGSGAITGCQFHPERSGPAGLRMIERFLSQ